MLSLSNKVALITGAASGIGRATAKLFHQQNARVVGVDMDLDGLKSLKSELGNNIDIYQADISKESEVKDYMKNIYNEHQKINILCNIAGITRGDIFVSRFHQTDLSTMRKIVDVNLWGSLYNCYYAVPYMLETAEKEKEKQGAEGENSNNKLATPCSIVNTSSVAAERAFTGTTDYVISKHGVNGLTYSVAAEYSSLGIRCNAIEPPGVDTPMAKKIGETIRGIAGDEVSAMIQDGVTKTVALRRNATPEEMANVFLFLASDEASFITGSVVLADGGQVKIIPAP